MASVPSFCPHCQAQVHPDWPFCSHCGSRLDRTPPPIPVCENCGAAVDVQGAFCWKCGVPLLTGRQPFIPAPAEGGVTPPPGAGLSYYGSESGRPVASSPRTGTSTSPRQEFETYVVPERQGTSRGSKILIVCLVVAVVVLAFLWLTPYGSEVIGRPGVVTVTSISTRTDYLGARTGYFNGSASLSSCPSNCNVAPSTGSDFVVTILLSNVDSVSHSVYGWSVSSPFSLVAHPAQVTVGAGQQDFATITVGAPGTPGSYALTVTFQSS